MTTPAKTTNPRRRRLICVLLAASVLPALLPLWVINKYAVEFHFWDEWDPGLAGLYIKAHNHALHFADLFRQHNEHRILLPRLAYLALTAIDHWNAKWEMLAQWIIVCATSLGILLLLRRTIRERANGLAIALWFACNLLIFTPAAWQNWLWGMGLANVMPMAFVTAAIVVASGPKKLFTKIILCITLSVLATYSSGNGMLAWPLSGMILFWPWTRRNWKDNRAVLLIWLAALVIVLATYFIGYTKPDHRGAQPYANSIASAAMYVPVFLGSPFAYATHYSALSIAMIAGLIELALLAGAIAYFVRLCRGERRDLAAAMLVWLAVAGFALLSAVIAAVSRAGLGVEQALQSSRYVTFAVYLPVALVPLFALIAGDVRARRSAESRFAQIISQFGAALLVLTSVAVVLSYPWAMAQCQALRLTRLQAKAAALLVNVLPDNPAIPGIVYPDASVVLAEANVLDEMGYIRPRLIKDPDAKKIEDDNPMHVGAVGQLDRIGEIAPGLVGATGWAAFTDKLAPADAVFLTYAGDHNRAIIFCFAQIGAARPDVAQSLGGDDYLASGWQAQFPRASLPQNGHGVVINAWALDTNTGRAFRLGGKGTMP